MGKPQEMSRRWARIAATDDGKHVIEALKREFAWDEAGPAGADKEEPIHFWVGQRSVIKHILERISTGKNLSENQKQTDE